MKSLIAFATLLISLNCYSSSSINANGLLFMDGSTYKVFMDLSGNENLSQCWKEAKQCYSPIGGVWKIESFPYLPESIDLSWHQHGSYHRAGGFHRKGIEARPSLLLHSTGPNGFIYYQWLSVYDAQKKSLVGQLIIDTWGSTPQRFYGQMEIQLD